jgi:putative tryptophan/tyrosine transport system substrate-binding protein
MRKLLVTCIALAMTMSAPLAQEAAEEPAPMQDDAPVTGTADTPELEPTEEPTVVPPTEDTATVTVISFADHPANEGCLDGIRQGLGEFGYVDGETLNLVYESADGDAARVAEIIDGLSGDGPVIVAPIGTQAAVAAADALGDFPMVFCAVPDPVTAGLVDDIMRPGGKATGVSDAVPLSQQLALIREVLPTVVMLGVIYNPDAPGSVRLVERLEGFLPGAGFQLATAHVSAPEEVTDAMRDLAGEAHVIYVLPDDTVLAAFDDAVAVAEETDTPLFVADARLVERGAVGSRAFDFHEIGRQTANVMARVFDGEDAADIPVGQAELTHLVVNVPAAERMGLELAPGFVARADEVIE